MCLIQCSLMGQRDEVTPALVEALRARDGGCVAPRIGVETPCGGRFGPGRVTIEVDHVRSRGLGLRGPSTPENTWLLCSRHHRDKTENARAWRALFDRYLEGGRTSGH